MLLNPPILSQKLCIIYSFGLFSPIWGVAGTHCVLQLPAGAQHQHFPVAHVSHWVASADSLSKERSLTASCPPSDICSCQRKAPQGFDPVNSLSQGFHCPGVRARAGEHISPCSAVLRRADSAAPSLFWGGVWDIPGFCVEEQPLGVMLGWREVPQLVPDHRKSSWGRSRGCLPSSSWISVGSGSHLEGFIPHLGLISQ